MLSGLIFSVSWSLLGFDCKFDFELYEFQWHNCIHKRIQIKISCTLQSSLDDDFHYLKPVKYIVCCILTLHQSQGGTLTLAPVGMDATIQLQRVPQRLSDPCLHKRDRASFAETFAKT